MSFEMLPVQRRARMTSLSQAERASESLGELIFASFSCVISCVLCCKLSQGVYHF